MKYARIVFETDIDGITIEEALSELLIDIENFLEDVPTIDDIEIVNEPYKNLLS